MILVKKKDMDVNVYFKNSGKLPSLPFYVFVFIDIIDSCYIYTCRYIEHDRNVVVWSRVLEIRLSDWCCSVSMV
jgi:hypothetical protein